MKIIIALFVMFCVCLTFANVCNTPNNSLIIKTICDLKECQGYIKKSIIDSLPNTNKAISNSNEIKIDIKEANDIDIVWKISIILGSISVVVGSIMFIFSKKDLERKFETEKEIFKMLLEKVEIKFEERFKRLEENQKNKLEELK
ncbi:MAG: hypothetical protein FWC26_03455 [Fibromonadales bacterium]|nr:hypothetical protein [Fibromonadales bacterium]